MANLIADRAE